MTVIDEAVQNPASGTQGPAVVLENISKRFGAATVLDDVSLKVEPGAFLGLLGPNGAGKTTLISVLTGLVRADKGECRAYGFDSRRNLGHVKRLIGLVPQDLAVYPELNARENLRFFGAMQGLGGRKLNMAVADALLRVGLEDRATGTPVGKFSGGQKRRLNIAAALLHRPEILILDEPTVGVDPQSRNFIFETLRELNNEGMTILYVTHYMEEVEALCDEVVIMDHGRVIERGTLREVLDAHGLAVARLQLSEDELATAAGVLIAHPAVRWREEDGQLEISSRQLTDVIAALTAVLTRVSETPQECQVFPASLETVFITLTGNRLRDE